MGVLSQVCRLTSSKQFDVGINLDLQVGENINQDGYIGAGLESTVAANGESSINGLSMGEQTEADEEEEESVDAREDHVDCGW